MHCSPLLGWLNLGMWGGTYRVPAEGLDLGLLLEGEGPQAGAGLGNRMATPAF